MSAYKIQEGVKFRHLYSTSSGHPLWSSPPSVVLTTMDNTSVGGKIIEGRQDVRLCPSSEAEEGVCHNPTCIQKRPPHFMANRNTHIPLLRGSRSPLTAGEAGGLRTVPAHPAGCGDIVWQVTAEQKETASCFVQSTSNYQVLHFIFL